MRNEIRIIVRRGHIGFTACAIAVPSKVAVPRPNSSNMHKEFCIIQKSKNTERGGEKNLGKSNGIDVLATDDNELTAVALRRIVAVSANSTKKVLCPDNIL